MDRYKIVRVFFSGLAARTIKRGLTLEEAQAWCRDPETSSSTCTSKRALSRTLSRGPWFDTYTRD